jgi:hypothetical protein
MIIADIKHTIFSIFPIVHRWPGDYDAEQQMVRSAPLEIGSACDRVGAGSHG